MVRQLPLAFYYSTCSRAVAGKKKLRSSNKSNHAHTPPHNQALRSHSHTHIGFLVQFKTVNEASPRLIWERKGKEYFHIKCLRNLLAFAFVCCYVQFGLRMLIWHGG